MCDSMARCGLTATASCVEATVEAGLAGPAAPLRPIDYVPLPLSRRFQACFTAKEGLLDNSFVVEAGYKLVSRDCVGAVCKSE